MTSPLRADLSVIASLIEPGASLLDIGCGTGELLAYLQAERGIRGKGLEIDKAQVNEAIARGVCVVEGDIASDLAYYPDRSFDYVVITQALQSMEHPAQVLNEMARIGRRLLISVPNFGHWRNRLYLGLKGRMPVTHALSYQWYETPNIHFCTLTDFIELCEQMELSVERRIQVFADGRHRPFRNKSVYANLMAEQGVFVLRGQ